MGRRQPSRVRSTHSRPGHRRGSVAPGPSAVSDTPEAPTPRSPARRQRRSSAPEETARSIPPPRTRVVARGRGAQEAHPPRRRGCGPRGLHPRGRASRRRPRGRVRIGPHRSSEGRAPPRARRRRERVGDSTARVPDEREGASPRERPQRSRAGQPQGAEHGTEAPAPQVRSERSAPGIAGVEVEDVAMAKPPVTRTEPRPSGRARGLAQTTKGWALWSSASWSAADSDAERGAGDVGELKGRGGDGDAGRGPGRGGRQRLHQRRRPAREGEAAVRARDAVTLGGDEAERARRGGSRVTVVHVGLDGRVGVAHRSLGMERHQSSCTGSRVARHRRWRSGLKRRIVAEGAGLAEELASGAALSRVAEAVAQEPGLDCVGQLAVGVTDWDVNGIREPSAAIEDRIEIDADRCGGGGRSRSPGNTVGEGDMRFRGPERRGVSTSIESHTRISPAPHGRAECEAGIGSELGNEAVVRGARQEAADRAEAGEGSGGLRRCGRASCPHPDQDRQKVVRVVAGAHDRVHDGQEASLILVGNVGEARNGSIGRREIEGKERVNV